MKRSNPFVNPWELHTRQNGVRRYDQHLGVEDDDLGVWRGFANALILGLCAWGLILAAALLVIEGMQQ